MMVELLVTSTKGCSLLTVGRGYEIEAVRTCPACASLVTLPRSGASDVPFARRKFHGLSRVVVL
eukprot:5268594-Amphidinium_carterae.1